MAADIFGVIAPILIIAAIGYALEKGGAGLNSSTLSTLTLMVGTPALVFSALTGAEVSDVMLLRMSAGALAVALVGSVLSFAALRLAGQSVRTFLPSLTMPNSGNIGLPCVYLAFDEVGLAIGVAFFFVIAILQYTVMPIVSQGRFSIARTVREPLIWSVVAVIAFKLAGASPPEFVADTTAILGGMMIPVMIILLGGALARLKLGDVRLSVGLAVARLAIGLITGAVVTSAFGLSGIEAGSLFLLAAMPAAIVTFVFAERHNRSPEQVAGLIVASTLLTVAVLPAILWAAIGIADADHGLRGLLAAVAP